MHPPPGTTLHARHPLRRAVPPLRAGLLNVVRNRFTRPYQWAEHRHGGHEIILADQGTYRCRLNGIELALDPPAVLVVEPGDRHEDPLATPVAYTAIWMTLALPGGRPARIFAAGVAPDLQVARTGTAVVRSCCERMLAESEAADGWAGLMQEALAQELLWALLRSLPESGLAPALQGGDADAEFRAELRRFIARHLDAPLEVPAMARTFGLGPTAFAARCRRALGMPPAKALAAARLERAAELIASGCAVATAAERLGFASPFHFSRAFKRHFGEPPSQLLRSPGR